MSYTVTSSPEGLTATTSGTTAIVTGLTNGTSYTFTVRVKNMAGSNTSDPSNIATPATVPSAPTGVTPTAGDGSVSLSWTAPDSNGGASITNYKYSSNNGTTWNIFDPAVTSTPATISGLTNGQTYTFMLRAVNRVGDGTPSLASISVTPSGSGVAAVADAIISNDLSILTLVQVASITTSQMAGLTSSHLSSLSQVQMQAFTPSQIGALTSSQLDSLSQSQIDNLTISQLCGLSSDAIQNSSTQKKTEINTTLLSKFNNSTKNRLNSTYQGQSFTVSGSAMATAPYPAPNLNLSNISSVNVYTADLSNNITIDNPSNDPTIVDNMTLESSIWYTVTISTIPRRVMYDGAGNLILKNISDNSTVSYSPSNNPIYWGTLQNNSIVNYYHEIGGGSSGQTIPTPSADTSQTFTSGKRVADLTATGTNLKWYAVLTGGTALSSANVLTTRMYYVSQTVNGTESERTSVSVTITSNNPACVCENTTVLTPNGYINVATLKVGDCVVSDDNRQVKIKKIHKSHNNGKINDNYPYVVEKNSIGENYPVEDISLSKDHLVKYNDSWLLSSRIATKRDKSKDIFDYYNLELENYATDNFIINNGTVVESYAPGPDIPLRQKRRNNK